MNRGHRPASLAILALLTLFAAPSRAASSADELVRDLQARGIRDRRVLDAFRRVPREAFATRATRDRAYDDSPLDIGHGQTMSQPYVVALMTEELGLTGKERVLEVGTGSGYSAAILATVAQDVYSVELVPELAAGARVTLTREGYRNVHVKQGDGALGWREYGPYDAVVVTAASPTVPRPLIDQLREGGVLVMPLGEPNGRQVLVRGVKRGTKLRTKEIADVRFVPLLRGGRAAPPPPAVPPGGDRRPPTFAPDEGAPPRPPRRDDVPPPRAPRRDDFDDAPPPPASQRDDFDEAPAGRAPRSDDLDERRPPPRALDDEKMLRDDDRDRPWRDLNEEDLPERDDPRPESDIRPLPAARTRVARAPDAPDSGRRRVAGAAACADVGSRAAARQRAA